MRPDGNTTENIPKKGITMIQFLEKGKSQPSKIGRIDIPRRSNNTGKIKT